MARPHEFNVNEALHQAMDVFWRKGYEATSMADLLDAMALSKSSLYATFGSKRELFVAAFDAYRVEREHEMQQILACGNGRQAIEHFFRKIVSDADSEVFSRGCMSINQAVEMAPHDAEIRLRVFQDLALIEDALTHTVARGKEDGSIRSADEARKLGRLLVLAFPGLQVMVRAGFDHARLDETLNLLFSALD